MVQNEGDVRGGTGRGAAFATGGGGGSSGCGGSVAQAASNTNPSHTRHRLAPDRRRPDMP
jgi:hypothetical protein